MSVSLIEVVRSQVLVWLSSSKQMVGYYHNGMGNPDKSGPVWLLFAPPSDGTWLPDKSWYVPLPWRLPP